MVILWALLRDIFASRATLVVENLALRQQLAVLKRSVRQPRLRWRDRWFWVCLSRCWLGWRGALLIVCPATVVRWHRQGFRLYWRWKSRHPPGRPAVAADVRRLIRQMALENATWGAPRICSELRLLGHTFADSTVAKYMPKRQAALANVADVPEQPCRLPGLDRLLRRTDGDFSRSLHVDRPASSAQACGPFCRDRAPQRRLGQQANPPRLSLRLGSALPDPGSRLHLWQRGPANACSSWDRGSADRATQSMAVAVGRATDRLTAPRMLGPGHRPQ
jgi:hypothetical protein